MRQLILILFLTLLVSVQANAEVKITNGGNMRTFYDEVRTEVVDDSPKVQKSQFGDFSKSDYLICVLLVGAYILMRGRKSRRVDF